MIVKQRPCKSYYIISFPRWYLGHNNNPNTVLLSDNKLSKPRWPDITRCLRRSSNYYGWYVVGIKHRSYLLSSDKYTGDIILKLWDFRDTPINIEYGPRYDNKSYVSKMSLLFSFKESSYDMSAPLRLHGLGKVRNFTLHFIMDVITYPCWD